MQKYKQVKVNFKPDDFKKLELLADDAELTKAQFIRKSIGGFSIPTSREKKGKVNLTDNNPMLFEVAKIGTNVNQIARFCNQNKGLDIQVLAQLVAIEKSLKALLL